MSKVFRRGKMYHARVRRPDGSWSTRSTGRLIKSEAERIAAGWLLAGEGRVTEITFRTFKGEYLARLAVRKGAVSAVYLVEEVRLNRVLSWFDRRYLTEITGQTVDAYMAERRAAGIKAKTLHKELQILSKVLQLGISRGHLAALPWVKIPRLKSAEAEESEHYEAFSVDELRRLMPELRASRTRDLHLYCCLMYYTGSRPGRSIFGLRWADVDLDRGRIVFRPGFDKTGRTRDLSLDENLAGLLRERRRGLTAAGGFDDSGPVVAAHDFREAFKRSKARAGLLRRGLTFYSFRHTYATRLIEAGADAATVAAILGNSAEMVLRVYAHVFPDRLRAVQNLLPPAEAPRVVLPLKLTDKR